MRAALLLAAAAWLGLGQDAPAADAATGVGAASERQPTPREKFNLGVSFMRGMYGFEKNSTRAAELFTEVGETEDDLSAAALNNLGTLYAFGTGVRKDEPKAMDCFYKAAAKGNLLAEYNLGEIFAEGKVGVKVDLEAAKKWYGRAARKDDALAQNNYALLLEDEGDTEAAKEWLRKASATDAGATYNLGLILEGHGAPWNETETLWKRAVEMGSAEPGEEVTEEYEAEDAEIGVFGGNAAAKRACFALGTAYLERGDNVSAEAWLRRGAASYKDAHSTTNLAALLLSAGEPRASEARPFLEGVARREPRAAACLGVLLAAESKAADAARWFREAARHGDNIAKNGLAALAITDQLNATTGEVKAWLSEAAEAAEPAAVGNWQHYQACASSLARSEKFACPFASPRQAPCRPLARSNERHKHESVVDENSPDPRGKSEL